MIKPLIFDKVPTTKASDGEILEAESVCGFTFPSAFREFCQIYNGGFAGSRNTCYTVPKEFREYHSEYSEGDLLVEVFYGLTKDPQMKACDVIEEDRSEAWLAIRLFPIARDLLGNQFVINKEQPEGPVYFRDHELWVAEATPKLFQIADNLEEFYNGLGPDPDGEE
jgi:hypothetical protein